MSFSGLFSKVTENKKNAKYMFRRSETLGFCSNFVSNNNVRIPPFVVTYPFT